MRLKELSARIWVSHLFLNKILVNIAMIKSFNYYCCICVHKFINFILKSTYIFPQIHEQESLIAHAKKK